MENTTYTILYEVKVHAYRTHYFEESRKSEAIDFASLWRGTLKAVKVQKQYDVKLLGLGA